MKALPLSVVRSMRRGRYELGTDARVTDILRPNRPGISLKPFPTVSPLQREKAHHSNRLRRLVKNDTLPDFVTEKELVDA